MPEPGRPCIDLRVAPGHLMRVSSRSHLPGAFAVLRSRNWRPLLLAFAILAGWARLLAPAGAATHALASATELCRSAGPQSLPQAGAPEARSGDTCPFCRLPEIPGALVAPPVAASLAGPAGIALASPRQALLAARRSPAPPARGPPAVASSS